MAYLRKRATSSKWVACFFGPSGERIQRSTGTENRKEAMRMALDWESAAKDARTGRLTTERARGYLNSLLEATGQTLLDTVSVQQFAAQWLEGIRAGRSAGTARKYSCTLDDFFQSLGQQIKLPVSGITPLHIEAFKTARIRASLTPASVNVQLKIIRSLFAAAHRQGVTQRNPATAVEFLSAGAPVREEFSTEEIEAILKAAKGTEWETAILFGYFCGMRIGDACHRRWTDIDLVSERVTWIPEKTSRKGKIMVLPLHPRLQAHLEQKAGRDDPAAFLTPELAKGNPSGLAQKFHRIMKQAGIAMEVHAGAGEGRARITKSFHSLRHSLNSHLLAAGVDEAVRVLVSGHADVRTNRRYSHVKAESFREALNRLPGGETK